jgi:hypothetical protein
VWESALKGPPNNRVKQTKSALATRAAAFAAYAGRSPDMTDFKRTIAVLVTSASLLGCGVKQEKVLDVRPPVQEARINTYGWSRMLGLGQEIWVTLQPTVLPAQVADLTVFGPFKPGMTQEEAVALAGRPTRTWNDAYGQTWYEYERPAARVQVGCECSSSGGSVSANCLWRLYALRSGVRPEAGLDPQLASFVAAARAVPETVDYRLLQLNTADNSEFVTWPIESKRSSLRILWHDRNKSRTGGRCKGA